MNEAAFPLLGTAFVLVVLLPACALIAKLGLATIERYEVSGPLHSLNLRYVLLTGSSAFPLVWLVSAALHQAESGKSVLACLFDHDAGGLCLEPGFFALSLGLTALFTSLRVMLKHGSPRASSSGLAGELLLRVDGIISARPALRLLTDRILVSDDPSLTICTHGLIRPRVVISTRYAACLSDPMLAGALGHELQHVGALDPFRYLLLQAALNVNPLGRFLLAPHASRWQIARETQCDRAAVIEGAAPLSLAHAIVLAARPSAREVVALGASDTAVLKFRVSMLLAFAERAPASGRTPRPSTLLMPFVLLLVTLLLPHQTSTFALDALHTGAEHTVTYFVR